uniref:LAGLIDADG homing endonuclease n=1 Tax=Termitomyces sp. TaxID=1916073 RepID=A0A386TYD8_9AGAR|nr:LAGLIDADG homing endonuclease [Termitomyces sp.]AYE93257.1 LAGLIDADG homing endonuclease [Termitomyces sp.]
MLSQKMNKFNLSPGYISGLTQTDGSFFCSMILSSKHRFGIQFRPKYTITADLDSKYVLDSINSFFNCGKVTINNRNHTAEFEVVKLDELNQIIIPHFNNYPVFCAKLHAFNLFKEIVNALVNKEKRTIEGRRELLKLALSMNITTNRTAERIDNLFSLLGVSESKDKTLLLNNIKEITTPLSSDNISGIIDGDGSFFISFQKDGKIKTGFNITNDLGSKPLLEEIQKQLRNIGSIQEGSKNELVYTVNGLNQINEVLIPFIDSNPLFSERASHYEKFKTVSIMLANEKPLSLESKLDIVELAYDMNKKGKRRNLSKSEYRDKLKNLHQSPFPKKKGRIQYYGFINHKGGWYSRKIIIDLSRKVAIG